MYVVVQTGIVLMMPAPSPLTRPVYAGVTTGIGSPYVTFESDAVTTAPLRATVTVPLEYVNV